VDSAKECSRKPSQILLQTLANLLGNLGLESPCVLWSKEERELSNENSERGVDDDVVDVVDVA
jgi:hypothetical protein